MTAVKFSKLQILAIALLAGVFAILSTNAFAQPVISWEPVRVLEEIEQGETRSVSLKITSSQSIENAQFFLTPELAPYVTVPTDPFTIAAGSEEMIEVLVSIPEDEPFDVSFDGSVQIKNGRSTLSRPLPIRIEINEQTLIGEDADGNGIWDYIEDVIKRTYVSQPELREIQFDGAKSFQKQIVGGAEQDEVAVAEALEESRRWVSCLNAIENRDGLPSRFSINEIYFLESIVVNSDRQRAAIGSAESLVLSRGIHVPVLSASLDNCP